LFKNWIIQSGAEETHFFFKWLVCGKGGFDDIGCEPANSSDNAVSVAMAHCNVQHRVFAVEQFFSFMLKINKVILI
jgi:hypothetical protein